MSIHKTVIKFESQDKELERTEDKLERLGKVDKKNADQFRRTSAAFKKHENEKQRELDQTNKKLKAQKTSMQGMSGVVKNLGVAIAGAFAVDRIIAFGNQVVNVRGEFEKLQAVLATALGSKGAAAASFSMIQKLAAETPFSVRELTSSFVKLVNQGFKPTQREMRKLGDLAAATGKQFDQVAEAVIDAQVGEFERLKELGILARKNGDTVTAIFKGQTTEIQNTSEAIRGYIVSLGDAEGISGSMAAISETLEGRISNLGDAWDSYLDTIGRANEQGMKLAIKSLADLIVVQTDAMEAMTLWNETTEESGTSWEKFLNKIKGGNNILTEDKETLQAFNKELKEQVSNIIDNTDTYDAYIASLEKLEAQRDDLALGNELEIRQSKLIDKALDLLNGTLEDWLKNVGKTSKFEPEDILVATPKEIKDADKAFKKYMETVGKGVTQDYLDKGDFMDLFPNEEDVDGDLKALDKIKEKNRKQQAKKDKNAANQELKNKEALEEMKLAIATEAINSAFQVTRANQMELTNQRLQQIDREQQAGNLSAEQADAKRREIMNRAARQQKNTALFEAALGIPLAIIEGFIGSGGNPFGAAAGGALASLQFATIAATPVPKYRKGVVDMDGKGTGTSDSNLAWLSKGESVITSKATQDHKAELKMMNRGIYGDIVKRDYPRLVAKAVHDEKEAILMSQLAGALGSIHLDDDRIVDNLKSLKKIQKNQTALLEKVANPYYNARQAYRA